MVIIVIHSIQKWLPFEKILENGIIKLKNNSYIMILKIKPINYNLKSELVSNQVSINGNETINYTLKFKVNGNEKYSGTKMWKYCN